MVDLVLQAKVFEIDIKILKATFFSERVVLTGKYLLVMTAMIDLVTLANDFGERWRLASAVDNHALQAPRRVR